LVIWPIKTRPQYDLYVWWDVEPCSVSIFTENLKKRQLWNFSKILWNLCWKFHCASVGLIVLFITCNNMIISTIQVQYSASSVLILMLRTSKPANLCDWSISSVGRPQSCTLFDAALWYVTYQHIDMKSDVLIVTVLCQWSLILIYFLSSFSCCHYFCSYSTCVCVLCIKLVNLFIKFELSGSKFSSFLWHSQILSYKLILQCSSSRAVEMGYKNQSFLGFSKNLESPNYRCF